MYLKSIEIQGFKSFANRIKFEFPNGITGIVGPNGSGKSNVSDAVRWVLGEQRVKQLRGDSMQDVIFSGTENRKPLSYASVAITLDNEDGKLPVEYAEVTVTRKLYRSGESEYLMNGTLCRLKDIQELFYDTGIGKEGYSIIGQGQIERILSGKPEERRELFDEAAGIVKFKRRKQISLKKLEEERQNLVRVKDILSELEKQIEPLQRQSEKAREYLKKKEQLKIYDINLFLLEGEHLRNIIEDVEKKLALVGAELEEANEKYASMKSDYEAVEKEAKTMEESIEKTREQLHETTLFKQQLKGQIEVLREQIHAMQANIEHYQSRLQVLQLEIKQRETQKIEFLKEKASVEESLEKVSKEQAFVQEELKELQIQMIQIETEMEENKSEIMDILSGRASTEAKIQHFETTREQVTTRRAQLHRNMLEVSSEAAQYQEEGAKFTKEIAKIMEDATGYQKQLEQNEKQLEQLQIELRKKQDVFQQGQTTYHRETSRLESLKNLAERYDGYGSSIRKVMGRKKEESGIIGVVADIIKVEKQYEVAIETALGGSIQNIVTDTEETAKRIISYLKEKKYGRATFLPLTSIQGGVKIAYPEVLKEAGVIGLAHTLVQVEEKFLGLANQLLGRTVVVENIEQGISIARKYKQSLRLVTLEGELLNPGGSITGGAFKNTSNLLSRRREIEELEDSVLLLKEEIKEAQKSISSLKQERASYYVKNDQIQEELRKLSVEENTARMNLKQMQNKHIESKQKYDAYRQEQEQLENEVRELQKSKDSLCIELETSKKREEELKNYVENQQIKLKEERLKESEKLKAVEKANLTAVGLEQRKKFLLENIQRLEEEYNKLQRESEEVVGFKENSGDDIQEKEEKIQLLEGQMEASRNSMMNIENLIVEQTKQREALALKNKEFLESREVLSQKLHDLDKEKFRLQSQKNGYEETLEKQINYMWEEYELTYNRALELKDATLTDLNAIKKQIQDIRLEIRNLGNVNVNAIEDFQQVSKRYEFLKEQHEDLVEAEATLLQIIEELDLAMRKQFQEQFARISKEFDSVFKQLFGGGKGTLELLEEEDILEAGIKIIAQPPGKKLQNMMQLSGGEKALTAISLLFAIQNLKPSPFCLLDEIEAALDDSNVERFAKYLHKLTKNTQFIVITHRRGTMAAADRLYGITMQEKGISTLVSVDLLEDELEA